MNEIWKSKMEIRVKTFIELKSLVPNVESEEHVGFARSTQVQFAVGTRKVSVRNNGKEPTAPIFLRPEDSHSPMTGGTVAIDSLAPGASAIVTLAVKAILGGVVWDSKMTLITVSLRVKNTSAHYLVQSFRF